MIYFKGTWSFINLALLNFIILIIATTQSLSDHTIWLICVSQSQIIYFLDYFHHYFPWLMHLFSFNCKMESLTVSFWFYINSSKNQVALKLVGPLQNDFFLLSFSGDAIKRHSILQESKTGMMSKEQGKCNIHVEETSR